MAEKYGLKMSSSNAWIKAKQLVITFLKIESRTVGQKIEFISKSQSMIGDGLDLRKRLVTDRHK